MSGNLYLIAWIAAVAVPLLILWLSLARKRFAWATTLVLIAPYAMGVWAFLIEPKLLVVRHVEIVDPDWRGAPLRIGVMSDTHIPGPHMSPARLEKISAKMNAEKPDIILLLGDFVGGHEPIAVRAAKEQAAIQRGIEALSGLRAPLGTYAVIGNHDTWYDAPTVEAALSHAGATVLVNEGRAIGRPDGWFWLAGLGDLAGPGADYKAALNGAPPDAPVIAIAHWPDVFDMPAPNVALTLAAHSHCGQVNLPVFGRLLHPSPGSARYPCGLYDVGGRKLYVTGGVGTSIFPVRFNATPEIVIVTLKGRS